MERCEHNWIDSDLCPTCAIERAERKSALSAAILKVINTAIGTATSIVNMTDDKHVQVMAAHIADTLAALTNEMEP